MRVHFGRFALDRATRQLLCDGQERHLEPKAFDLLDLLLERRPEAVAKAAIRDRLWPDTFVSESSLTGLVAQIRQALEDDPRRPGIIRTVHGFGYAFTAEASGRASRAVTVACDAVVIWGNREIPLARGENVLGRDETLAACIDAPGVSRRHARVLVGDSEATLEDLGSKNGTYLIERRLEGVATLHDGDSFRLGRQLLVFRRPGRRVSTLTESGAAGPVRE